MDNGKENGNYYLGLGARGYTRDSGSSLWRRVKPVSVDGVSGTC